MKWTITLDATTACGERVRTTLYTLERPVPDLQPEEVGLTLVEAQELLSRLQEDVVCQQAEEYTTCRRVCPRCF